MREVVREVHLWWPVPMAHFDNAHFTAQMASVMDGGAATLVSAMASEQYPGMTKLAVLIRLLAIPSRMMCMCAHPMHMSDPRTQNHNQQPTAIAVGTTCFVSHSLGKKIPQLQYLDPRSRVITSNHLHSTCTKVPL